MKVPVLITVPHGGRELPAEASTCLLSPHQIALDSDTWARELYDLRSDVLAFFDTSVPRAIVDLNRAPGDVPPANLDGVIKTETVNGTQVWPNPLGPGPELIHTLLERHYTPWHEAVRNASARPGIALGLDCHTMLAVGPPGHPLAGKPRPVLCLSNGGDATGISSDRSLTASTELTLSLFDNLTVTFRNEDVEIDIEEPRMRLNDPFRGGHISRHHSMRGPLPWIQLELSRALYLPLQFGPVPGVADVRRLADLRGKILSALRRIL